MGGGEELASAEDICRKSHFHHMLAGVSLDAGFGWSPLCCCNLVCPFSTTSSESYQLLGFFCVFPEGRWNISAGSAAFHPLFHLDEVVRSGGLKANLCVSQE